MTDDKKKEKPVLVEGIGWRYETKHNMLRRMKNHDYYGRSIYMITMVVEGRRPLLGDLVWKAQDASDAHVEASLLGAEVERCWFEIQEHYPDAEPLRLQLMPDHIHGLIFIKREQEAHLGKIMNGFKIGCNKAYRRIILGSEECSEALPLNTGGALPLNTGGALPLKKGPKHPKKGMLFSPGYNDSILKRKGQLDIMIRYMDDNPRRLAIKRMNPDLFKVVRNMEIGGRSYAAIGNLWLLDRPVRMQVRCHRDKSAENLAFIEKQKEFFLKEGAEGAVIVSPCISTGEKEIARAALDAKIPLITILENGFNPMYKPSGKYFDACVDGLLLMLAPWDYHTEKHKITRGQCNELNEMAKMISNVPWEDDDLGFKNA